MKETHHFIVNGHDHGAASLGEYRRDLFEFSDLTKHRLNAAEPGGGECSKSADCQCGGSSGHSQRDSASEPPQDSSSTRLPSRSREIAKAAEELQVAEALALISGQSEVFSLFGGIDTEVVFLEDCSVGGYNCAVVDSDPYEIDELRPGQTLKLGIVTGLVVISAADPVVTGPDEIQAPALTSAGCAHTQPKLRGAQALMDITSPPQEGAVEPVCGDWKVDDNEWKLRYNPVTGCSKKKIAMVKDAYRLAYKVVRSAEQELAYIASQYNSGVQKLLWDSYGGWEKECSLAFWFGKAAGPDFALRLEHVSRVIRRWSRAFREGFYHSGNKPVLIHCKPVDCASATAQHIIRNYIVLCKQWSDLDDPIERMITLMHEMGHYSDGDIYHPRDESYKEICNGGWKSGHHQCYRGSSTRTRRHKKHSSDPGSTAHFIFVEGSTTNPDWHGARNNPHELVKVFDGYPTDDVSEKTATAVRKVFLNNVDNYTCYMWNRWVDREYCHLESLAPDNKQAP